MSPNHARSSTRSTAARALPILVITGALLLPAGVADTFTTYDFGEAGTTSGFGTFHVEHDVTPGTGLIELYASATIDGGVDAIGRIGATYVLNSGDLLVPFTAVSSTKGDALGTLSCPNFVGGTVASLSLTLQQWRQTSSTWVLEDTAFVDEWSCPLVTVVALEPFSGAGSFTYQPGETYRIVVEALARAQAVQGSEAIVDFCASGTLQCGILPDHIIVKEIKIPNQAPVVLFQDGAVWYVDGLLSRAEASGRGCDIDGNVRDLRIWVDGNLGDTLTPVNAICGNGSHFFLPLLPGTYTGNAEGRDDEGAVTRDTGTFEVGILPPLQAMPVGFPDLGAMTPGLSAKIETWLAADGSVLAYRLVEDGRLVGVSGTPAEMAASEHVAVVEYDVLAARASVALDGEVRWSGLVAPALDGQGWWDLRPLEVPSALPVA